MTPPDLSLKYISSIVNSSFGLNFDGAVTTVVSLRVNGALFPDTFLFAVGALVAVAVAVAVATIARVMDVYFILNEEKGDLCFGSAFVAYCFKGVFPGAALFV